MSSSTSNHQTSAPKQAASKMPIIESQKVELVDISTLQHDPGLRPQMWEYLLINMMKLDMLILKIIHIDSFLLIVLDIRFHEKEKIIGDLIHLSIKCFLG